MLLALLVLPACGKRGDPQPPLPRNPQPITGLRLSQRGDVLEISYTAPRLTTANVRLGVLEVELLRAEIEGDLAKVAKRRRVKVAPGETLVETEPLPPPGTSVRVAAQAYSRGQPSSLSPVLSLKVVPPPPRPPGLKATLLADGVSLAWDPIPLPPPTPPPTPSPSPSPSPTPSATPTPSPSPSPSPSASPTATPSPTPTPAPTPTPLPVPAVSVYRREGTAEYAAPLATVLPAEGFVDRSVTAGQSVCYVVRTVVSRDPLIESAPSEEACLTVRDISAPAAPSGIAVLAREEGIEVSWSPSPEADLDRYRVYRALAGGARERLAEVPSTETSYLDRTLPAGASALYSVTATDKAGNESAASAAVEGRRP